MMELMFIEIAGPPVAESPVAGPPVQAGKP
jgi:hypothetical protein